MRKEYAKAIERSHADAKQRGIQIGIRDFLPFQTKRMFGYLRAAFDETDQPELDKLVKEELGDDPKLLKKMTGDLAQFDAAYRVGPHEELNPRKKP